MPIHLLLRYYAVSTLGAAVSKYASASRVFESSGRFLRATYVGHKCVGLAKYKKYVGLSHRHKRILLVCARKTAGVT